LTEKLPYKSANFQFAGAIVDFEAAAEGYRIRAALNAERRKAWSPALPHHSLARAVGDAAVQVVSPAGYGSGPAADPALTPGNPRYGIALSQR
jgi:predicted secreted protein